MNPFEKHYQNLATAKSLIGKKVIGQRPNTYNEASKISGLVVSVRETISDYGSMKPAEILVDINHNGTVTPCHFESVEL